MQTKLRTARTILQNAGRPAPNLTMRQRQTRERILTYGQTLMAAVGTLTLKFSTLAAAIHVAPTTLRRHFADLDDLLNALLIRHLDSLLAALTETPDTDPDRDAKRRATYLALTRTPSGALTEAHLLLVRDRPFLPPEERDRIEAYRHEIGTLLAGDRAQLVLPILDNPFATANDIAALLGNLREVREPHQAAHRHAALPPPRPPSAVDFMPNKPFIPPPSFFAAREPEAHQLATHIRAGPPATPPPP
jgi:AcrR family transcriptional regulator